MFKVTILLYLLYNNELDVLNMKLIGIFIAVIFFISCNTEQDKKKFSQFPKTIQLKGETVKSRPFKSMDITGIVDSLLIISTMLSDYEFYLFNKKDFSFIGKAGKTGRGPKELTSPVNGNIDKDINCLYSGDRSKLKLFRFDLNSMIQHKNYLPELYMELPEKFSLANRINVINDSIVLGSGISKYSACLLNKEGKIIKKLGKVPERPENIDAIMHSNLYTRFLTYNHDQRKLALGYFNFDKLKGFNLSGSLAFKKTGPDFIRAGHKDIRQPTKFKTAYHGLRSDNHYIYGLYSGRKAATRKPQSSSGIKNVYPKNIHIFNWKGNPLLKVILDQPIVDFIVDKDNQRLIGLAYKNKPFSFVVYDFEKIQDALN